MDEAEGLSEEPLAAMSQTQDTVGRLTLCGSTRFRAEYELWNRRLSMAGFLVYSVSCFGHSGDPLNEEEKARLDRVHLAKIDASHAIVVVNPGGYIGDSTRREIQHAKAADKTVYYTDEGSPTVFQLRTGPNGPRSLRYRAFDLAARAESRSTPDREGADADATTLARCIKGDRCSCAGGPRLGSGCHCVRTSLARPASSAGGVEEAVLTRVSEALKRAEHVESRSCEVRIDDLRTMLAALTQPEAPDHG